MSLCARVSVRVSVQGRGAGGRAGGGGLPAPLLPSPLLSPPRQLRAPAAGGRTAEGQHAGASSSGSSLSPTLSPSKLPQPPAPPAPCPLCSLALPPRGPEVRPRPGNAEGPGRRRRVPGVGTPRGGGWVPARSNGGWRGGVFR